MRGGRLSPLACCECFELVHIRQKMGNQTMPMRKRRNQTESRDFESCKHSGDLTFSYIVLSSVQSPVAKIRREIADRLAFDTFVIRVTLVDTSLVAANSAS